MKKLKGGFSLSVSPDSSYLISIMQNKVYVHDVHSCNCIGGFKVFPNVSSAVMSHNGKMIAAKNTSGKIAVLEYPSGKILGTGATEKQEGCGSLCFSKDDSFIFDFDWCGNIMKLDLADFKHDVLYKFNKNICNSYYDEYTDEICIIDNKGNVLISPYETLSFKKIKIFPKPVFLSSDIFCEKKANVIFFNKEFYLFDKKFNLINKVIPDNINVKSLNENIKDSTNEFLTSLKVALDKETGKDIDITEAYNISESYINELDDGSGLEITYGIALSDNGKMLFAIYQDKSFLFELSSMNLIKEYNYPYTSSARFIDNDTKLAIGTWKGTYLENICDNL